MNYLERQIKPTILVHNPRALNRLQFAFKKGFTKYMYILIVVVVVGIAFDVCSLTKNGSRKTNFLCVIIRTTVFDDTAALLHTFCANNA